MRKFQASEYAVHDLSTMPSNRSQRVLALVIGAAVCVISLLLASFARVQLAEMQAYQPAVLSAVICFELITAYVLYSQFRVNRMPSVLMLSAGYLFSRRTWY